MEVQEKNPIGQLLIALDNGVALFVTQKVFGMTVVPILVIFLYLYNKKIALSAIVGVTIFQLWLLWYLTMANGRQTI
jgi:hypothetical protein